MLSVNEIPLHRQQQTQTATTTGEGKAESQRIATGAAEADWEKR